MRYKFIATAIILIAGMAAYWQHRTPAEFDIIGPARVIDGDTIRINSTKIRLFGIDAPELKQTCIIKNKKWSCGADATAFLSRLINMQDVKCATQSADQYGRKIAVCVNYEGIDLNAEMVAQGRAIAYTYYTHRYYPEQIAAQWHNRGIWQGEFTEPYQYRKTQR